MGEGGMPLGEAIEMEKAFNHKKMVQIIGHCQEIGIRPSKNYPCLNDHTHLGSFH